MGSTNPRLVRPDDDRVSFTSKDYRQGDRVREMTLPAEEFIRRFLLSPIVLNSPLGII